MFKKANKAVSWLTMYGSTGNITGKIRLMDLFVPEAILIEKSIEFFRDPAPCVIHRSAVMSRLMMELECVLRNDAVTLISNLPPEFRRYLSGYADACSVCMTQEDKA